MVNTNNFRLSKSTYLAWFSISLFFFYQYFLRVSPGIMIHDLRAEFQMTAEEFATLGSYYLYAYSFVQIPLGIVVDRIGVKKTVIMGLALTIGAGFLLAISKTVWMAQLSRILLGVGSGAAFLCSIKYVADNFKVGNRAMMMGGTLTLGLVGAIFAGSILSFLMNKWGWHDTIFNCSLFGCVLMIFILFSVKENKSTPLEKENFSLRETQDSLKEVLKNPTIIVYALLAVGLYAPESVLADLWGTGFIMQKYSLNQSQAAFISTSMYLGLAVGNFILPWYCEKHALLNKGIQLCTASIFVGFIYILFGPALSAFSLIAIFIAIGFFSGAEMMCFTGATLHTTQKNSGLTIGVVNTFNMLIGAILQQGIGSALDFLWKGGVTETGIRCYSSQDYIRALSILLGVIGACGVLSLFLEKKKIKELPTPI